MGMNLGIMNVSTPAPNSSYTVYTNVNSSYNDISNSIEADETTCQNKCSDDSDCYGYVYNTGKNCWLKNEDVFNAPRSTEMGMNLGIMKVSNPTEYNINTGQSISNKAINNIDQQILELKSQIAVSDYSHASNACKYYGLQGLYAGHVSENAEKQTSLSSSTRTIQDLNTELLNDKQTYGYITGEQNALQSNVDNNIIPAYLAAAGHQSELADTQTVLKIQQGAAETDVGIYGANVSSLKKKINVQYKDKNELEQDIYNENIAIQYINELIGLRTSGDNTTNASILQNAHNGIMTQNGALKDTIDNIEATDLHGQKVYYQNQQINGLGGYNQYLMYLYYILILGVGVVLYGAAIDTYLKIAFFLLFLMFPLFIGPLESTIADLGTRLYDIFNLNAYMSNNY